MVLQLIFTGILVGILSGLIGSGGTTLLVPILTVFFTTYLGVTHSLHYAIATGLAVAALTSIASLYRYTKDTLIDKDDVKKIAPLLLLTNGGGVVISMVLPQLVVAMLFVVFIVNMCVTIILPSKKLQANTLNLPKMSSWVGFQSGLVGISGGSVAYSYWVKKTGDFQKAAAISAFITLLIAVMGCIFGVLFGLHFKLQYATGYIYWPAVLLIAPFSMISTQLGVKLNKYLPNKIIKIIFLSTMAICAVMLLSTI